MVFVGWREFSNTQVLDKCVLKTMYVVLNYTYPYAFDGR